MDNSEGMSELIFRAFLILSGSQCQILLIACALENKGNRFISLLKIFTAILIEDSALCREDATQSEIFEIAFLKYFAPVVKFVSHFSHLMPIGRPAFRFRREHATISLSL
jgi:hypothetical protein